MRPLRQVKGLQFTIQSLRSCVNREQTSKLDHPLPTARPRLTACGGITARSGEKAVICEPSREFRPSCYNTKKLARKSNGRSATRKPPAKIRGNQEDPSSSPQRWRRRCRGCSRLLPTCGERRSRWFESRCDGTSGRGVCSTVRLRRIDKETLVPFIPT